jgi:hypothetical protein
LRRTENGQGAQPIFGRIYRYDRALAALARPQSLCVYLLIGFGPANFISPAELRQAHRSLPPWRNLYHGRLRSYRRNIPATIEGELGRPMVNTFLIVETGENRW